MFAQPDPDTLDRELQRLKKIFDGFGLVLLVAPSTAELCAPAIVANISCPVELDHQLRYASASIRLAHPEGCGCNKQSWEQADAELVARMTALNDDETRH